MTSPPDAPPAVEHRPPQKALLRLVNPVFRAVLQSPLHGLLERTFRPPLLVLHITGRKSGRRYSIVVGAHDVDGALLVFTGMPWRENARGGTDVEVTRDGVTAPARAILVEDEAAIAGAYATVVRRIGWKAARRQVGVKVNVGRVPTYAELLEGVRHEHLSVIRLDPA
jgi:hypothetical protein